MKTILPVPLIERGKLTELVEQKRSFNFSESELNIYETRKVVHDFPLRFRGFTVTSMLRGKKVAHLPNNLSFDYNPGHSIFTPSYKNLSIDFPKASLASPTQCIALSLDDSFVRNRLDYFNEIMGDKAFSDEWKISTTPVLVNNNEELVSVLEKISRVAANPNPYMDIEMRLLASQLILSIVKMQNLKYLTEQHAAEYTNHTPFDAVLNYIRSNIQNEIAIEDLLKIVSMSKSAFYRSFMEELGVSPYQLIIEERLKAAKKMLLEDRKSIKETAYTLAFSSPNYFIRMFKKYEGMTPGEYLNENEKKKHTLA